MQYKYCPICGRELVIKDSWDEGGVPYCNYDNKMFFNLPKPCVVVAIVKEKKILLLKQSYIYKNSKVLLSGYVGIDEIAEETVVREVKEEAGIEVKDIKYLGSDFVKDKELLMLTYMATYASGEVKKSLEVEDIFWEDIHNALNEMREDEVGKKVVKKVLKELKLNCVDGFKSISNSLEV